MIRNKEIYALLVYIMFHYVKKVLIDVNINLN